MIPARAARARILQHATPLISECLPLQDGLGRFLAAPVTAPISLPVFDNAAMDGFAVRSSDFREKGFDGRFQITGVIAAGSLPSRPLKPRETVRIMTGAPMPESADAVVPFEEAVFDVETCQTSRKPHPGENVRKAGEDICSGDVVLDAGERVTPRVIALLAALGFAAVSVTKKPVVKLFCTGEELSPPGAPLRPGKIYDSNGPTLMAALHEMGLGLHSVRKVADHKKDLQKLFTDTEGADVLITVGGVSRGDYDFVPQVLSELGADIIFHKVAIKPGKPFLFAKKGKTLVFGLPGNPVSAFVIFDQFVRPALLKMMGAASFLRQTRTAVAAQDFKTSEGKEDYLRGIVTYEGGRYHAKPAGAQGSAHLKSLARANAVLIIPEDRTEVREGQTVSFEFLEAV